MGNNFAKAKEHKGTSYIHVIAPCPTGWSTPTDKTVAIAKDMVASGLWYLAEYEGGEYTLNRNPKRFTSVADCLKKQGRFKGMSDDDIALVERQRDAMWERIRTKWLHQS